MPVQDLHPDYLKTIDDWQMVADAIGGDSEVKAKRDKHLPRTAGMIELAKDDSHASAEMYRAYLNRADFPHWVKDAVRNMVGLTSRLVPEIELDANTERLLENATHDGFGLDALFHRTVTNCIENGRFILLADVDEAGHPYIATYPAQALINWKTCAIGGKSTLTLAVLKESKQKDNSDEFSHEADTVYRVLRLELSDDGETGIYSSVLLNDGGIEIEERRYPSFASGENIGTIPLVVCGSTDNTVEIDEIPLLTMAKASFVYYRLSADYYQQLHDTSHAQPYIIDGDQASDPDYLRQIHSGEQAPYGHAKEKEQFLFTGGATVWELPHGASVNMLEITGNGLEAKRTAMADQKNIASEAGARVIDTSIKESGEARKARQDDQHASLHGIVITAAKGIEKTIKTLSIWLGSDEKQARENIKFIVKPDFSSSVVDANILAILERMQIGNKISLDSLMKYIQTGKVPEMTVDGELIKIDEELAKATI